MFLLSLGPLTFSFRDSEKSWGEADRLGPTGVFLSGDISVHAS